MTRLICTILFDTITTMSEFQEIVLSLLDQNFKLEIAKRLNDGSYSDWQLIIHK